MGENHKAAKDAKVPSEYHVHQVDLINESSGSLYLALQVNIEGQPRTIRLSVDDIPTSALIDQEAAKEIQVLLDRIEDMATPYPSPLDVAAKVVRDRLAHERNR